MQLQHKVYKETVVHLLHGLAQNKNFTKIKKIMIITGKIELVQRNVLK